MVWCRFVVNLIPKQGFNLVCESFWSSSNDLELLVLVCSPDLLGPSMTHTEELTGMFQQTDGSMLRVSHLITSWLTAAPGVLPPRRSLLQTHIDADAVRIKSIFPCLRPEECSMFAPSIRPDSL